MLSTEMDEKNKAYLKNSAAGSIASVAGGLVGSYICQLFSDSPGTIATVSTISQYAASIPTFSFLHARDNKDLYVDEGKFRWNVFFKDMGKLSTSLIPLDYVYLPVRSFINYWLQTKGYDPLSSSIISDMVCIPAYVLASVPVAKALKIIRKE